MIIRREEQKDFEETENLTREAFFNVYRPGCFEHLVVHKLRNDKSFVKDLDYIIVEDNKIIANIVYAEGTINLKNGEKKNILTFGPVSVLPEYQKKGYGAKLIEYTMEKAKELGYSAIIITGNPDYYKRFGFVSASNYNIYYEGNNALDDAPYFMICILDEETFKIKGGYYKDPSCYNVSEEEVRDFDKKFPPKKKEKRPGQLE